MCSSVGTHITYHREGGGCSNGAQQEGFDKACGGKSVVTREGWTGAAETPMCNAWRGKGVLYLCVEAQVERAADSHQAYGVGSTKDKDSRCRHYIPKQRRMYTR